jgi:hypothetical protein
LFVLTGCIQTTTKDRLARRINATHSNSFISELYYIGSSPKYDYFNEQNPLGSRIYRLTSGEVSISNRMPRTEDTQLWRRCHVDAIWWTNSPTKILVPAK